MSTTLPTHSNSKQMVKLLLEANADLTIVDEGGRMPLHWCSASNSTKCMQALCKAAAERRQLDILNVADAQGMAPLVCLTRATLF